MRTYLFLLTISLCNCSYMSGQDTTQLIHTINDSLQKEQTTISNILTNPRFLPLHSLSSFRNIIEQQAGATEIKIVTENEPGKMIRVQGEIVDQKQKPLQHKLVYIYQTSAEGWYSDTAPHILKNEGDRRHARLFGYFKTDDNGAFRFVTVQPKGYPNSSLPAHIHFEILPANNRNFITELLFDDDPRLVGDIRSRSVREGFFISKNTGTEQAPVYFYKIVVPD